MTADDGDETAWSRRGILKTAGAVGAAGAIGVVGTAAADDRYGDPEYPSEEWFAREQANYDKTREEPIRQGNDPGFTKRWQEQGEINYVTHRQRTTTEETEWERNGLCETWRNQCTGDPYLYPSYEPVWPGDPFYEETGDVERVVFYDSADEAARLNGRVWAPADSEPGDALPGVVIMNGGVATETMYWWFAQSLVEQGYVALTFDPVGQGRSEDSSDNNVEHHVDALDFFTSTDDDPYPHNEGNQRADHEAVPVADYNPFHDRLDRDRIGTAGHSMGAGSTSVVQGLDPWPGVRDENPVRVAVAWDNLDPHGDTYSGYAVEARVPTMSQSADYKSDFHSWVPVTKTEPPDPEARNAAVNSWIEQGIPAFQVNVRGATHFEWSRVPTFPATSWESWGNELADHYSLAWFDFWLKRSDEPGGDDAEYRLLEADPWHDRLSFYYASKYSFPSEPNAGWPQEDPPASWHTCDDVLGGC